MNLGRDLTLIKELNKNNMAYKQPSSGLPFKEMGSSPAKQNDDLHKAEAHSTSVKKPIETHVDHSAESNPEIRKIKEDYAKDFFKKEGEEGMTKEEGMSKMSKVRFQEGFKKSLRKNMETPISENGQMSMKKEKGKLKKKFIGPKNKITQKKSTDFDPETMGTN